jgi:trk system potassium uptake protein TrkA
MSTAQLDLFEMGDGLYTAEIHTPEALAGKSLAEADVRKHYDVTVLAIRRIDDVDPAAKRQLVIPRPDTQIRLDDRLLVFGTAEQIEAFSQA